MYKEGGEKSKFLKLFSGLPFLEPEDLDEYFVVIMAFQPDDEGKKEFTDYFLDFVENKSNLKYAS